MEYQPLPNLLLESLSYLGARANGHSTASREARLRRRGLQDLSRFRTAFSPLEELQNHLDAELDIPGQVLDRLFRDLEGFPFNTTGSFSPAFLLCYPMLAQWGSDPEAFARRMGELTPDEAARFLHISLSLDEDLGEDDDGCADRFIDLALSLTIPAESRLNLLTTLREYPSILRETLHWLTLTARAIESCLPQLDILARQLGREIDALGCEAFLQATSSLTPQAGVTYLLRPYIFGPDSNLSLTAGPDTEIIHCGIFRQLLLDLLVSLQDETTRVHEAIKLLGDRTRFDILCYLRDRSAYGQELSDRFGLARNTIHHHMNKLLNAGLVTCTVDGSRVYYAMDRENLSVLLAQQQALLLPPRET